jgi:hypothetical protein
MTYQMTEWQNPTGYIRDEKTGLYSWIDPVTGNIVKSSMKPPGIDETFAEKTKAMFPVNVRGGAMYFNTQEEANQARQRTEMPAAETEGRAQFTPQTGPFAGINFEDYQRNTAEQSTDPYILLDKKVATWDSGAKLNYKTCMVEAGNDPNLQQMCSQQLMNETQTLDVTRKETRGLMEAVEKDQNTNRGEKDIAIAEIQGKLKSPISLVGGVSRTVEIQQKQRQEKEESLRRQQLLEQQPQQQTQQQLETATVLRKEFQSSKAYTDYEVIQRSERGMKQAYNSSIDPKTTSKVASDQALAVLFQKMLDPGSVVRESEYARTPEGVSIVNRIQSWIPKLRKGGMAISNADRKALYDMGQKLLNEAKTVLDTHINRYTELSTLYGIDPKFVLGGIKPSGSENIQNMSNEELERIAAGGK